MAGRKMAAGGRGITQKSPPGWLEWILTRCLSERDRETISGDLLEEYREEQLPRLGFVRANLWYLRQAFSFVSVSSFGGPVMKLALTWMSVFTAAAGAWLAFMEQMLKHSGYGGRTVIGICIAMEGIATVLFLLLHGRAIYRTLVLVGAIAVGLLGASAVMRILGAPHFEGFVLIIGSALVVQGMLAIVAVLRPHRLETL